LMVIGLIHVQPASTTCRGSRPFLREIRRGEGRSLALGIPVFIFSGIRWGSRRSPRWRR
jgi:hypothetical protein